MMSGTFLATAYYCEHTLDIYATVSCLLISVSISTGPAHFGVP